MRGLVGFLRLQAQARTGLSGTILAWAAVGSACAVVAFAFILLSAFVGLADRVGPLVAALVLAVIFLLVAIIALVACLHIRNATRRQAVLELAQRKRAMAMDPKFVAVALQVGRALAGHRKAWHGKAWRWAAPALAVAALAGLGIQLLGRRSPHVEEAEEEIQTASDRLRQAEQRLQRAEHKFAKAA
jgi:hypothetical protein